MSSSNITQMIMTAGFGPLGFPELLVILVLVLVVFGVGKLPGVGDGLGQAIKNFKKAMKDSPNETNKIEEKASPQESQDHVNPH